MRENKTMKKKRKPNGGEIKKGTKGADHPAYQGGRKPRTYSATDEELQALKDSAKRAGMNLSAFIRSMAT